MFKKISVGLFVICGLSYGAALTPQQFNSGLALFQSNSEYLKKIQNRDKFSLYKYAEDIKHLDTDTLVLEAQYYIRLNKWYAAMTLSTTTEEEIRLLESYYHEVVEVLAVITQEVERRRVAIEKGMR